MQKTVFFHDYFVVFWVFCWISPDAVKILEFWKRHWKALWKCFMLNQNIFGFLIKKIQKTVFFHEFFVVFWVLLNISGCSKDFGILKTALKSSKKIIQDKSETILNFLVFKPKICKNCIFSWIVCRFSNKQFVNITFQPWNRIKLKWKSIGMFNKHGGM